MIEKQTDDLDKTFGCFAVTIGIATVLMLVLASIVVIAGVVLAFRVWG